MDFVRSKDAREQLARTFLTGTSGLKTGMDFRGQGPVSRNSRKLFRPEKPFLKLRSAYSEKLVFCYDLKIRKVKFVAKFHTWKRRRF